MKALAMLLLMAGCANPPTGFRYGNPNCVRNCVVNIFDASGAPALTTLNTNSGTTTLTKTEN